ncbi:hypothetical protein LTR15_005790 [Elasticomyces elasticus]|nr:hypothetical protein LTR15_005790 [Elasticomyces elasticus]
MAINHTIDRRSWPQSSHYRTSSEYERPLARRGSSATGKSVQSELSEASFAGPEAYYRLLEEAKKEYVKPRRPSHMACAMNLTAAQRDALETAHATIDALHLLSGTVSIDQSFRYLEHARQTIEGASGATNTRTLQGLRCKTAELWTLYEQERAGKLSYAWPAPVRD